VAVTGLVIGLRITSVDGIEIMENLMAKLANMLEILLEIGLMWSDEMANNFATAPWPPLSPITIAKKGHATMLVDSGKMKQLAEGGEWSGVGGGGKFIAQLKLPRYWTYHQTGTRFMPQRDFTALPDSFVPDVADVVLDWLSDIDV